MGVGPPAGITGAMGVGPSPSGGSKFSTASLNSASVRSRYPPSCPNSGSYICGLYILLTLSLYTIPLYQEFLAPMAPLDPALQLP